MFMRFRIAGSVRVGRERLAAWSFVMGMQDDSTDLPDRLADGDGCTQRQIEAAATTFHGNEQAGVSRLMHVIGYARRFASKQYYIAIAISEFGVGQGGFGGKQQQAPAFGLPPRFESAKSRWRVSAAISR